MPGALDAADLQGRGHRRPALRLIWHQVNLYGSETAHEHFLAETIAPDATPLSGQWFFVRYHDRCRPSELNRPRGQHLRLRSDLSRPRFAAWLERVRTGLPPGALRRSVYRPETRRYGGAGAIEAVEAIFCWDSALVATILRAPPTDLGRVGASVAALDGLLRAFRLTAEETLAFYRHVARCGYPRDRDAPLDALYDRRRDALLSALGAARREQARPDCLAGWEERLAPPARRLRALEARGALNQPLRRILESLVHMHCNRLGLSPEQERGFKWCLGRAAEELS